MKAPHVCSFALMAAFALGAPQAVAAPPAKKAGKPAPKRPPWARKKKKAEEEDEKPKPPPPPPPPPPVEPATPEKLAEARKLFEAGARAYQYGDFPAAIQAFEKAYKVSRRPNLIFSMAQAHRRQYVVDRRAGHVAAAIKYYRHFLEMSGGGKRRADAAGALERLEALAEKLEADGKLQPLDPTPVVTRLVASSPTEGATVKVGDSAPQKLPLVLKLNPGKHTIVVSAPGFVDDTRTVDLPKGAVVAFDVTLKPKPARIRVTGPAGAQAVIDDRISGVLPLASPIEVAAGRHQLRVTMPGRIEQTRSLELGRADEVAVDVALPTTTQRKASFGLMGAGGALVVSGLVTGAVMLVRRAEASDIKSDIDAGVVVCRTSPCVPLDDYTSALDDASSLGVATGLLLGVGGAMALGGGALFLFDDTGTTTHTGVSQARLHVGPGGLGVSGTF